MTHCEIAQRKSRMISADTGSLVMLISPDGRIQHLLLQFLSQYEQPSQQETKDMTEDQLSKLYVHVTHQQPEDYKEKR